MTLTPLQSWLLVVAVFAATSFVIYAASRPSWTHRKRHRLHDQHLDELARYERARARLAHLQSENPGHVRLGHRIDPTHPSLRPRKDATDD